MHALALLLAIASHAAPADPVSLPPRSELMNMFAPALPDVQQIPNNPALTDTWFFGAGATFMNSNTQAELKSSLGVGASVDFEDAFGLENSWAPELLARWRFSERWRVEMEKAVRERRLSG